MCVFVGVCVYVCVLAYVWLSLCMHVPNQPEHKNHWQANWLTLIVLLQCGVLLEKKKKNSGPVIDVDSTWHESPAQTLLKVKYTHSL